MFYYKYTAWNMDTLNSAFDFLYGIYFSAILEPISET